MKGWIAFVLLVFSSCSPASVAELGRPGPVALSDTEFVAQIPAGTASWNLVGHRLESLSPSIHVGDQDSVVLERANSAGSTCEEIHIDNLGNALKALPAADWPDGRTIVIRATYGLDEARSARVRRQEARVRALANRLQITVCGQTSVHCG
jgi:hypothetical protein